MLQVLKDVEVVRHAIVLHHAAPFRLVLGHNTLGIIERSLGQRCGLLPSLYRERLARGHVGALAV
jgi:hypothetical protein